MKKRLFVAIPLPDVVKAKLVEHTSSISGVRLTTKGNLHITVCFIGWTEIGKTAEIMRAIKTITDNTTSFSLRFEQFVFAPSRRSSSMIWALYEQHSAFTGLVGKLEKTVQPIVAVNKQHTTPHVTLARFKKKPVFSLPQVQLEPLHVRSLTIFESRLSPKGPTYTAIETLLLR